MRPKGKIFMLAALLLVFLAAILVTYASSEARAKMPDIASHWAQVQIEKWVSQELVKGYPDGSFKPDKEISRAEFVALVNRAFKKQKKSASNVFSDVKVSDWFYQEVLAGKEAGYITGYPDGTFKPHNAVTRQEVAVIIAKLLKVNNQDDDLINDFKDVDDIAIWAKEQVSAVVANELMQGYPDGNFNAQSFITRAEAVVTLERALALVENSTPPSRGDIERPKSPSKGKNVMGYYVRDWPQDTASQKTLEANGDLISSIGTFEFSVDEQGNLSGTHDVQAMDTAREKNVKVLALVHNIFGNSTKSKAVAKAVLTNSTVRAKTINNIFSLMERYGYDGINIDIEYVAPADRASYTAFIKGLAEKLKPKGYAVTVSVPAKLKEDPNHGWSGGFDYAALKNYADLFMIMAYDEHGYVTNPGPIASIDWDEQIINYTLSVLSAEKVLLGIPTYGFDWTVGQGAPKYLSYQQAMKIAQEQKKTVLWDDVAKVPYFKYTLNGQKHEVWFENTRSMEEKLKLINKYNLGGIAVWRLGFEDPGSWTAIDKVLDVQK